MIDPQHLETVCAHLHGKVGGWVYRYYGGMILQRVPYYTPTNPRTGPQQAWRRVFADAIASWQALSEEEKNWWREKGKKRRIPGVYLFRSHYLRTHQPYHGVAKVDFAVVGYDWVD